MKPTKAILLFILLTFCSLQAHGQIIWHDAADLPLLGKVCDTTSAHYTRLPASMKETSRPAVWELGQNAAGLAVRFRTNAPEIYVRWTSTFVNAMNHMAPTGERGIDMYIQTPEGWHYAGTGRPVIGQATTESRIVTNMTPKMRECMIYLSLYDGISDLHIGVLDEYVLESPVSTSPSRTRPVVMYGTSILQGGCATRPGMASTNILSRMLDREVINLGFSGNAFLDEDMAQYMASVPDPGAYVLDECPNSSVEMIEERGEHFFRILRDAHPDTPVIFVEMPAFAHSCFNTVIAETIKKKNAAQRALYEKLRKSGEKHLYYIKGDMLNGNDGEATVDGIHATDLGMQRYADEVLPTLRKALKGR